MATKDLKISGKWFTKNNKKIYKALWLKTRMTEKELLEASLLKNNEEIIYLDGEDNKSGL